ncbi:LAMI_0G04896g1_1 [Lachancea mirantina]|uniref:LAMI_0G04896g1_1 n=1 Tax=Lachancea mirantina TaxID=1230905 RepID=A0A1G4K8L9_9SACH|nr:LAMI_0G04896g1_1 [Lachancea mirantina]
MFEIKLNDKMKQLLKQLNDRKDVEKSLKTGCISMHLMLDLCKSQWSGIELEKVICPLEFQFKEQRQRTSQYTPEFREKMQQLRLVQEEAEYQAMLKRDGFATTTRDKEELTPAQMNKQIREQVTTMVNVLVSVASVVFAAWYWSNSSARMKIHHRILLCLFTGILVLVAEVVVYNSYLQKLEDAKLRERAKKERKEVVKTLAA